MLEERLSSASSRIGVSALRAAIQPAVCPWSQLLQACESIDTALVRLQRKQVPGWARR